MPKGSLSCPGTWDSSVLCVDLNGKRDQSFFTELTLKASNCLIWSYVFTSIHSCISTNLFLPITSSITLYWSIKHLFNKLILSIFLYQPALPFCVTYLLLHKAFILCICPFLCTNLFLPSCASSLTVYWDIGLSRFLSIVVYQPVPTLFCRTWQSGAIQYTGIMRVCEI